MSLSSDRLSSAALSITLAVVGYVSTALHTLRAQQHQHRVARVGEQLKELYGPLLACVTASRSAYDAMLRQAPATSHGRPMRQSEFREIVCSDPRGPVAAAYRTWVREVFMPLSEKAARLVVDRADLLESSCIEPLLLQLVAHVSALKVLVRRWEQGEIEDQSSPIAYPDDVQKWAEAGASALAAPAARCMPLRAFLRCSCETRGVSSVCPTAISSRVCPPQASPGGGEPLPAPSHAAFRSPTTIMHQRSCIFGLHLTNALRPVRGTASRHHGRWQAGLTADAAHRLAPVSTLGIIGASSIMRTCRKNRVPCAVACRSLHPGSGNQQLRSSPRAASC